MDNLEDKPKNVFEYKNPESEVYVKLQFPDGTDASKLVFNPKNLEWLAKLIGLSDIDIIFENLGQDEVVVSFGGSIGDTMVMDRSKGKVKRAKKFRILKSDVQDLHLHLINNTIRKIPVEMHLNRQLIIQKIQNSEKDINNIDEWVTYLNQYTDKSLRDIILAKFNDKTITDRVLEASQIWVLSFFAIALVLNLDIKNPQIYLIVTGLIDFIIYLALCKVSLQLRAENKDLEESKYREYRFDPFLPLGPQYSRTLIALITAVLRENGLGWSNHFDVSELKEG